MKMLYYKDHLKKILRYKQILSSKFLQNSKRQKYIKDQKILTIVFISSISYPLFRLYSIYL
jgi:hypothetical protein